MIKEDQKFPAENALLGRFERIADDRLIAEELGSLLGRAPHQLRTSALGAHQPSVPP